MFAGSPLGPGNYTFINQETGTASSSYVLTFQLTAVAAVPGLLQPWPGVLLLAFLLLGAAVLLRRDPA
jgi:hypothetical protein